VRTEKSADTDLRSVSMGPPAVAGFGVGGRRVGVGRPWCIVPPIVFRVIRIWRWLVGVLVALEPRPLDVDGRGFERFLSLYNLVPTASQPQIQTRTSEKHADTTDTGGLRARASAG